MKRLRKSNYGDIVKIYSSMDKDEIRQGKAFYYAGYILGLKDGVPLVSVVDKDFDRYDYYLEEYDVHFHGEYESKIKSRMIHTPKKKKKNV